MAKLLTNREMELFRRMVMFQEELNNCNPDVGMNPSRIMVGEKLAKSLSFEIDPDDIAEACEYIEGS